MTFPKKAGIRSVPAFILRFFDPVHRIMVLEIALLVP